MVADPEKIADLVVAATSELALASDVDSLQLRVAVHKRMGGDGSANSRLAKALRSDGSLAALQSGWLSELGGGQAIHEDSIQYHLIKRSHVGADISVELEKLRAFSAVKISGWQWYGAIVGIVPSEHVQMAEGVELIGWSDVPACAQKTLFDKNSGGWTPGQLRPLLSYPNCAVRVTLPPRQVLFGSQEEARNAAKQSDLRHAWESGHNLLRCCTLLLGKPTAIVGAWYLPTNASVCALQSGYQYSPTDALSDNAFLSVSTEPEHVDAGKLSRAFARLSSAPHRGSLLVALDRLAMSLRRVTLVDRAIDLGVAMEALLLQDLDGDRGELTYRQAIRGATYLGGSQTERRRIFDLLRATYKLRSHAVHSGRLRTKEDAARSTIQEATKLCLIISQRLLDEDTPINWETYVLGGSAS